MAVNLRKSKGARISRKHDIISAILNSDHKAIDAALEEDASCINAIHESSGMNAVMLATHGNMEDTVAELLEHAHLLDFEHCDNDGEDLMLIAMGAASDRNMRGVFDAYQAHAVHLLNNFEENSL